MSLEGKVAIVTGGGAGIGSAYVAALAKAGAKVVIADIDQTVADALANQLSGSGHHVTAVRTDVTSEADTLKLAAETIGAQGLYIRPRVRRLNAQNDGRFRDVAQESHASVMGALPSVCLPQSARHSGSRVHARWEEALSAKA